MSPPHKSRPAPDLALVAFVVVEVFAFCFFFVAGRRHWFYLDEWYFLVDRGVGVNDLVRPHAGHLVALPVLMFRLLFQLVGLRSYLPYLGFIVASHVAVAGLLRCTMRRAGVGKWTATVAASAFALFGSGSENILWAFQIAFTGALGFGLVQLILADHDGSLDKRDWLGFAAGVCALLFSGVALAMVAVVAIASLIRRGWRAAVFHALPVGLYLLWWIGHRSGVPIVTTPSLVTRWFRRGFSSAFDSLGQLSGVGWALAAILVAGAVLAWRDLSRVNHQRRAALPLALLGGMVAFLISTGVTRSPFGIASAAGSRYLYVYAALLIVPLATAADALVRRSRPLGAIVLAVLVVGIPANLRATPRNFPPVSYYSNYEQMMRSLPRMRLARAVPSSLHPDPHLAPLVTIGWLRDAARSGRLPAPRPSTPRELLTNRLRLSLDQRNEAQSRSCPPLGAGPMIARLAKGQMLAVHGAIAVQLLDGAPITASQTLRFGESRLAGSNDHTLVAVAGPLRLRISPASRGASAC